MEIRLLLFLCFFFQLHSSSAQHFRKKPYLLIENSLSGKRYAIKPRTTIFLKTKSDSTIRKVKFTGFASSSSIYIQDNIVVQLSDIDYLSFKPVKLERIAKQVIYGAGIVIFTTSLIAVPLLAQDPGAAQLAFFVLFTPPITILSAFTMGHVVHGLTPYYALRQGETSTLKIVME